MHLPFIAHTRARQVYVTIMRTRLKRAFRFISFRISCTDKCTERWRRLWKYLKGWATSAKRFFSKQYSFACYRASQSKIFDKMIAIPAFTTRIKRIVISVYLNSVCYLISYTRLFTKLNLFKILLYVTFLTTKFSRSTVFYRKDSSEPS